MEQKIPVKNVEIQIYGAKRTLKRPRQGSSDEALLSTPRAEAAAPPTTRPFYDQYMSCGWRGSLQTAQKYPLITVLSRFGRIWGAFWTLRNETAPMGCAPGHRSSSFCRFGAIHGVPKASHDLSPDLGYRPFHQRKLR